MKRPGFVDPSLLRGGAVAAGGAGLDSRLTTVRVLACFMVILLHVAAELLVKYPGEGWWAGNFYDSLVRSSVPLFLMLAGATMLRRDEPMGRFYVKRAWRVLPPLVFWSAFYLAWLRYNGGATGNWLLAVLTGPTMYHLWYFYALVGLYAILPVLRKFYAHASRQEHLWFLGLWFVVASVLPTGYRLLFADHCAANLSTPVVNDIYHLGYFGGYIGYLILGAVIADSRPSQALGLAVFLASSAGTMLGTAWLSGAYGRSCDFFFAYLTPLVVFAAAGLFSAVMARPQRPVPRWMAALSDCSLGIYGLHVFMIEPVFYRQGWRPGVGNPWLSPLLVSIGVFLACFAVVWLVRLVRPLRRII